MEFSMQLQEIQISFLCVLLSCCVWRFRRWQSLTFYQTAAAFVPGGRPLYVVNASTSIWVVCCNPASLSLSSPLQVPWLPRNCIAVFVLICSSLSVSFILKCSTCIHVDVLMMQHVKCLVGVVSVCYIELRLLVCCQWFVVFLSLVFIKCSVF